MAIVSSGALVDELRQIGLLASEHLAELTRLTSGRCGEPRSLVKSLVQRGWLTVYQMNQLLAGNGASLVLGSYRILDRLGQGGLSQVYKARHADGDWLVALKVLKPEALGCEQGRQQFIQEME